MTLPVATRLISVLRADLTDVDDYDTEPVWAVVASGVRAVISQQGGLERTQRGEAETLNAALTCDPIPAGLFHTDLVRDDTGVVWSVQWVQDVLGLGLDHISAGLVRYDGQVP